MSSDELVYLGILAVSISVGFLFRYLSEYFGNLKCSIKNPPKKVSRDSATLVISELCNVLLCFGFLQFQRHLRNLTAAGDWWIILSFHLHSRSPGEAGHRASARPPFYRRHLSHPHAPLAGDRDWNMDNHKKLLAVRSSRLHFLLFYIFNAFSSHCLGQFWFISVELSLFNLEWFPLPTK